MKKTISRLIIFVVLAATLVLSPINTQAFANTTDDVSELYNTANKHLQNGELHEAIAVYDEILVIEPENTDTMLMKGIALSNLDRHKQSMKEFYKVLEKDPNNISAMIGMGVGFGNFGEYKEAAKYFDDAYVIMPNDHVVKNYQGFAETVVKKYPYNEVKKPEFFEIKLIETIPAWVKNTAGWWASDQIEDAEFLTSMQFLIKNDIIKINSTEVNHGIGQGIPAWVKNTAGWWASDQIEDAEFLTSMQFLIKNGLLVIELSVMDEMTDEERKTSDRNRWQFARYLDRIEKTVSEDKRYIEYPNPSNDVIKKFLRDYATWNFEQQIKIGNKSFPNPNFALIDEVYHVEYKIYINKQPHGLPLDHVGTLDSSFKYWEDQELKSNDGKSVKIHFITTKSQTEANLWVTWVVRDIGENVLGHANLGKGVIEVALGGYGCDGNFQLFDVETVEIIMTHELGHGVGLKHSVDPESIMYPTIKEVKYAYCLLDISD
ncbi:MAG: matrixin family metalloprotease [Candidatus Nitrosopelagicus sp.]|nr:matrixin family metalloprotease [Candidatus Nitrosopelagicus sp.]